jgi:hypothetical protein
LQVCHRIRVPRALAWTRRDKIAAPAAYAIDYFRYFVFTDSAWDPTSLEFAPSLDVMDAPDHQLLDASSAGS